MKLITLKTLTLHNFMGYKGDTTLDFDGKDIVGILAEYEDDSTRSNRGGKSTILEAIGYNLTGLSRTKNEEKLIHHGEKEMWVTGIYTDGDKDYTIKRGRDHKNKGILELDWIQKVSEVEDEIERIFGITPKDFHLTSFFKQADTEGFMKMKPSDKSAFLMQWLDNEHWSEKYDRASKDRKTVKEKLRDNENLKKALEASLEIDESLGSMIYDLEKDIGELTKEKESVAEKVAEVNNDLKNINGKREELATKVRKFKAEKEEIDKALGLMDNFTSDYNNAKKKYQELKKQIDELDLSMTREDAIAKVDELKARRMELGNTLNVAMEHKTGMCPLIKKSCDRITFDKSTVASMTKELNDLIPTLKKFEKLAMNHLEKTSLEGQMELQKEKAKRSNDRLSKKPEYEQRLAEINDTLPELADAISELNLSDLTVKKEELMYELNELTKSIKEKTASVNEYKSRIAEAKRAKEKIDTVVKSTEELQKKMALLNHTCFMFSKDGIPALEIENSFQEIEDNINYILDNILPGVNVNFSPDRELKGLEPMCSCGFQFPKGFRGGVCPECETPRQKKRVEEISFKIMENGVEQDFEMDSGGGKQVISYAVRIALTMLKRSQKKCNLNMLFLDEVDSALDPFLAGQIIGSITNFLTKKLGYQQVLLVSHKEQIKSSVPHIVKVTKHENFSTARFL